MPVCEENPKVRLEEEACRVPLEERGSQVVPCGRADTPGLQLYPGSSFGPDEFHRVSGCSLVGGRIARSG